MNVYIRSILILLAVSLLTACATGGNYNDHPMDHSNYGGYHPQSGGGPEPGDYALRAATSLQRVQEFASCDGEGHQETRSQSRTSERDFRYGGYEVRIEQRASCNKFGGQVMPPQGIRRNGPSSRPGRE